jgi:hypothetical protein
MRQKSTSTLIQALSVVLATVAAGCPSSPTARKQKFYDQGLRRSEISRGHHFVQSHSPDRPSICRCALPIGAVSSERNQRVRPQVRWLGIHAERRDPQRFGPTYWATRVSVGNAVARSEFRWLDDSRRASPRKYTYSFRSSESLEFERHVVLNHCVGGAGQLNPEGSIEGLLLGIGQSPIPDEYRDRQLLPMRSLVLDRESRQFASHFKLYVSRRGRNRIEEGPRRPLLSRVVLK